MVTEVRIIPGQSVDEYLKHMSDPRADFSSEESPIGFGHGWPERENDNSHHAATGQCGPEEFAICEVSVKVPDSPGIPWVKVLRRGYKGKEIAEAHSILHKPSSNEFRIDILSHSELSEIKLEGGIIIRAKLCGSLGNA